MIGDGHGDGRIEKTFLHDDMTAALSDFYKTILGENLADFFAGQDAHFTQRQPQMA